MSEYCKVLGFLLYTEQTLGAFAGFSCSSVTEGKGLGLWASLSLCFLDKSMNSPHPAARVGGEDEQVHPLKGLAHDGSMNKERAPDWMTRLEGAVCSVVWVRRGSVVGEPVRGKAVKHRQFPFFPLPSSQANPHVRWGFHLRAEGSACLRLSLAEHPLRVLASCSAREGGQWLVGRVGALGGWRWVSWAPPPPHLLRAWVQDGKWKCRHWAGFPLGPHPQQFVAKIEKAAHSLDTLPRDLWLQPRAAPPLEHPSRDPDCGLHLPWPQSWPQFPHLDNGGVISGIKAPAQ